MRFAVPLCYGASFGLLALIAILAGQGFAADSDPGAQAWAAHCVKCHRSTARIAYALPAAGDAAGKARLDRFLAGHHVEDAAARAALVTWLAAQASQ